MSYEPKSVLMTGGCGFLGSNTLNYLCQKYPSLSFVNIDRLDYCSSERNVSKRPNYTFYRLDITDFKQIAHILSLHKIDTVIHMAAMTHVDLSFNNSLEFTQCNVLGTHALLEAVRTYGRVQRFIHTSSDEVYGSIETGKFIEHSSILNPSNPYAASKAAAEHVANSYYYSFRVPLIVIRPNNGYGRFQYIEKLIPKFLLHLLRGEKCPVHGRGESRRNFIHANDFARAVETVLLHGSVGSTYNFGSENELSVMDVLRALIKEMELPGKETEYYEFVADRLFQDQRYAVDSRELKALGWKEEVSFEQGLKETVKWYKEIYAQDPSLETYWPSCGKPKLLIYGSRGAVGRDLLQYLKNEKKWQVVEGNQRISGTGFDEAELIKTKPYAVICTVGRTGKRCEQNLHENVRDNLYAPLHLAELCRKHHIYMVYIGTGCIFKDDEMTQPFVGNAYSTVKGYVDRLMQEIYGETVLNVRIRMPFFCDFEKNDRDYLNKLQGYEEVVMDVPNSFSVMRTVWPVLFQHIERKLTGTVNMCNPGGVTNRDIFSLLGRERKEHRKNITQEELKTRLGGQERCFYVLNNAENGLPTIREALLQESQIRNPVKISVNP